MNPILDIQRSEWIKLRRSWSVFVVKVIAIPPVLLAFIFAAAADSREVGGMRGWWDFATLIWGGFCLPIGVGLLAFMGWNQETTGKVLKHLLVQPHPRWMYHMVKAATLLALVTTVHSILGATLVPGALLVRWFSHALGSGPFPWEHMISSLLFLMLASIPLVALQCWSCARLQGPGWALFVSLLGLYGTRYMAGEWPIVNWVSPWAPLNEVLDLLGHDVRIPLVPFVWVVFGGSATLLLMGAVDFHRREAPKE